jgi:hypothetical protein
MSCKNTCHAARQRLGDHMCFFKSRIGDLDWGSAVSVDAKALVTTSTGSKESNQERKIVQWR